jgi:uncharacterized membrane protein YeaQ/YmgE (transglycosylase-associated protein family)
MQVEAAKPFLPGGLQARPGRPRDVLMIDFLNKALTVDTYTLVVVALLAGWSGVLTMHVLSKTMLALVFVPGFIFGALVANYLFEVYGVYPTPDKETNVVVACTLGIIAALLVLLVVTRCAAIVAGVRVQRHQFKRI